MTVSTDGNVFVWDIRKLKDGYVEHTPLKDKNSDSPVGGVVLEYDTNAGPTNFMVGTEQGQILSCNRKAKNLSDRIKYALSGHHGPIYGLRRNPFNTKYFLSIGDWTARVWVEDTAVKTPILTTKYHPTYLTGGTWSPSRPGVFFTIRMDGALDVWDLYYKHNEPTLTVQVSDLPLTAFAVQDTGSTVAVGTSDGCVSVLQLSQGLSEAAPAEKSAINAMFERETAREKNLEKAMKEAKVKARKEQARPRAGARGCTICAACSWEALPASCAHTWGAMRLRPAPWRGLAAALRADGVWRAAARLLCLSHRRGARRSKTTSRRSSCAPSRRSSSAPPPTRPRPRRERPRLWRTGSRAAGRVDCAMRAGRVLRRPMPLRRVWACVQGASARRRLARHDDAHARCGP
jgi:hypothetical protein